MREKLPGRSYFVFLSRAGHRPITDVWPIRLEDPLPRVPVPLAPPDPGVELDLQNCFASVYDHLGFDLAANYSAAPDVRLAEANREWASRILSRRRRTEPGE